MQDELSKYYEYLKRSGADVAPTFDSFKKTLSDTKSARQYYNYLRSNQFDTPDNFDSFITTFGLKKKEPSVSLGTQSPSKSETIDIQGGLTPLGGAASSITEITPTSKTTFDTGVTEGEYDQVAVDKATPFIRGILQGELANKLALNQTPNPQQISEIASISKRLQDVGATDAQNRFDIEGFSLFKNEPTKGAEFLFETIGNSLASLAVAGSRTVPAGVAVGAGGGSVVPGIGTMAGAGMGAIAGLSTAGLNLSTSQKILDVLRETGIDITDEQKLTSAFQDEKLMAKAREKALKYGIPIFLFDLASGGVAGKLSANAVGKPLAKKFLAGTGEVGIQSLFGGAGEAAGQLASEGKIDWRDVGVEALASIATDIPEIALGAARRIPRKEASSNNKTLATQVAVLGKEAGVEDAKINLDRDFNNGVIDETEYNEGLQFIEKAAAINETIPETVKGENRGKIIELIDERQQLEEKLIQREEEKKKVDVSFHSWIDELNKEVATRIEEINGEIEKIASKKQKDETIQTTEVPIETETEITDIETPTETVGTTETEINNYQKIKNYATEIETNSKSIRRLHEEAERGRKEGGIRNVEASILLSTGGRESSPIEGREQQELAIENYAKNEGIWYDNIEEEPSDGKEESGIGKFLNSGTESQVYVSEDNPLFVRKVMRIKDPFNPENKNAVLDFLDKRISIHNSISESVPYTLIGFGRLNNGEFVAVIEQPHIQDATRASQKEIDDEFGKMGYKKVGEGSFENENYFITDARPKNVLKDEKGNIHFIDLQIDNNYEPNQMGFDELKTKTEQNAIQEPSTESLLQSQQGEIGETGSGRERVEQREQRDETTQAQQEKEIASDEEIIEPPKPPKETETGGEEQGEPTSGITLAASAERRKSIGLDDYEKEAESFAEWEAKANEKINEGFDVEKMLDELLQSGRAATPIENAIRKIYAANLDAEIAKNPTNELLAKAKKLSEVGDILNSLAGRQLVSLKGEAAPRENITDFYVAKMEANGVDELTDTQKKEVQQQFEKYKKAQEESERRILELEELNNRLQAENELLKTKKERKLTTKKTKEQYAAERSKIIDDIKEKLKKARTGESGLTAIPVPYAKELFAIAPDVAKLLKVYVEEGVDNLQAVSKKIYEDLKDGIPEITQKDVVDIIAGKYRKEKPQKTELDQKLKDIQTEAKLIAKIEEAMSLEPDSEKSLIDKNRTVKELQDELRQLRKETGYYDESKLKSIISRNNAEAERLKERIANKDFEEKPKVSFLENPELKNKYPKLYEEYLNSIVEKRDAKHEFEVALAKDAAAKMTKTQKAFKFGKEALNTVKAIKSGVDDSFVFVQGGLAVLANPKAGAKSFINQWKNFFNEGRFKREIVRIHENKPLWNIIEKTGLDILDPQGLQDKLREEQLGGTNLLEKEIKIPGTNKKFIPAKYTTAPFERLYTSMGNSLRLEIFLKKMEQEGWTLEKNEQQLKDLARVVNEMTGRGKLHKKLEPASDAISAVIWSPKLLASTVNLMGVGDIGNFVLGGQKGYYRSLSPELRKFARKQTAAGIGMGVLIMAAYSLNPDKEVDYDPQSVTFGQIKDKKTGISYNIFGRFTSVARYITMMVTGKRTVDEKGQKISTARETWKFFRGKFNPVAGVVSDALITKKTFDGRPYELSELPKDLLLPISIGEIKKNMEEGGTLALLTRGIPSFLGIKVMNENDFTGVDKDLSTLIKRNALSSELDLDKYKNYKKGEAAPTKEEKKEFINKRDNYIEQRLRALWEGTDEMNVVIDENGEVVTKKFSDMTKDQAVAATTKIKSDATRKFKEEVFGEKQLTRQQEKAKSKLEMQRERVRRKNKQD